MHVNCLDVPRAQGHIEDIKAKYGDASNAYRVRVLGEFPTSDDETVIPLELVLAATHGFELHEVVEMPVNNLSLVFVKAGAGRLSSHFILTSLNRVVGEKGYCTTAELHYFVVKT